MIKTDLPTTKIIFEYQLVKYNPRKTFHCRISGKVFTLRWMLRQRFHEETLRVKEYSSVPLKIASLSSSTNHRQAKNPIKENIIHSLVLGIFYNMSWTFYYSTKEWTTTFGDEREFYGERCKPWNILVTFLQWSHIDSVRIFGIYYDEEIWQYTLNLCYMK